MSSLISSEDTLFVWAAVIIIVACAIFMEQKWKWAAKVNSCTLCIIGGILFANLRVTIERTYSPPLSTGSLLYIIGP